MLSCQNIKKVEKPGDLIPEEKMIQILQDLAIARTAKTVNKKVLIDQAIHPVDLVFEKYGIDSTTFVKSNEWYASDLDHYKTMFQRLKDSFSVKKNAYDSIVKVEDSLQKIEDSIRKATGKTIKLKETNKSLVSEEIQGEVE